MARRMTKEESAARRKQQEIAALGDSGTNFTALADLILDGNRLRGGGEISGIKGFRFNERSQEEINGLADLCAAQSNTFNREEWFAYLGNTKKIFVVNFNLNGLPNSNEDGTAVRRHDDDLENGTDYLVQAETPEHANELFTEWLEEYQLTQTRLASPSMIEEFEDRKAATNK